MQIIKPEENVFRLKDGDKTCLKCRLETKDAQRNIIKVTIKGKQSKNKVTVGPIEDLMSTLFHS